MALWLGCNCILALAYCCWWVSSTIRLSGAEEEWQIRLETSGCMLGNWEMSDGVASWTFRQWRSIVHVQEKLITFTCFFSDFWSMPFQKLSVYSGKKKGNLSCNAKAVLEQIAPLYSLSLHGDRVVLRLRRGRVLLHWRSYFQLPLRATLSRTACHRTLHHF